MANSQSVVRYRRWACCGRICNLPSVTGRSPLCPSRLTWYCGWVIGMPNPCSRTKPSLSDRQRHRAGAASTRGQNQKRKVDESYKTNAARSNCWGDPQKASVQTLGFYAVIDPMRGDHSLRDVAIHRCMEKRLTTKCSRRGEPRG